MNSLDVISATIKVDEDPFLVNINDLVKTLSRLLFKNLDIFVSLLAYQSKELFTRSTKLTFYTNDAGDVYQSFRMRYPTAKNGTSRCILTDREFSRIALSFSEQLKSFNKLTTFTDQFQDYTDKMWEACKCLIIPVRINAATIPAEEKERILRLWLSTAFTLPLLDVYNEKYAMYQDSILAVRNLNHVFLLPTKPDEDPKLNISKLEDIGRLPVTVADVCVSPVSVGRNKIDKAFRTYMYMILLASIEIIRKPCPNLKECKNINPDYDGACINMFDDHVNAQIKKIQEVTKILAPSYS